jgi:hypothetical protein
LDASRLWLHGYSNDFCCYIPSERLLNEGGYGGGAEIDYFALPATLQPGLEDKIIAEVRRQVPNEFHNDGNVVPADAAAAINKLVDGLAVGTDAEYERIPDIWRVAIDAGKRNDAAELRRLLSVSLPKMGQPAQHWQVVVIGGGIINGLSVENIWPRQRIHELIHADDDLMERWNQLMVLSAAMADDTAVRSGTRYDALRILGADEFGKHGQHLIKYLGDADAELQMGAISGLSDMESPAAALAIAASLAKYSDANKRLAIAALMRTDARRSLLRRAINEGRVKQIELTSEQVIDLRQR